MTYSLVGAPAVGFDLARLPGGVRTATVLRTAVAADPRDLATLAAQHPGPVRTSWQATCEVAGTRRLGHVLPELASALDHPVDAGALLHELESSLLGDVAALHRLVAHELLEHTWLHAGPVSTQDPEAARAADVLADAAIAAYVGATVPQSTRRAMALPFLAARLPLRDETVATGVAELDARLDELARADEGVRTAWRAAVDGRRGGTAAWAPAMHQATWALSLTDRLRTAFEAQMAAVGAFARAGFTARDAAYGVWNALSGVVQATVVGDLLAERDADVLLAPWREVHG